MNYILEKNFDADKNIWAINLSGEIDIFESDKLRNELTNIVMTKEADLFINCSNLEYIDSTTLGAFVTVLKKVKTYGGDIHLQNVRPNLAKLFKITNLDKSFVLEGVGNE